MLPTIEYAIVQSDIFDIDAEVIALKYAQAYYGVDKKLANSLTQAGIPLSDLQPSVDAYAYVGIAQYARAKHALFVGVPPLMSFDYRAIRHFASHVLYGVNRYAPEATHVCMTIHGAGYGLDEIEACLAQLEGCLDVIQSLHQEPFLPNLQRITIAERNSSRVERLREAINQYLISSTSPTKVTRGPQDGIYRLDTRTDKFVLPIARGGAGSRDKPRVFVAMSFDESLYDLFHYGIEPPVKAAGFLCERMDHTSFTGDIMSQLKQRIETASLVIAEMSGANPNVYLEVGYAWGKNKPTLLVAKSVEDLRFDARGHRCIKYGIIKDLEVKLTEELAALKAQDVI